MKKILFMTLLILPFQLDAQKEWSDDFQRRLDAILSSLENENASESLMEMYIQYHRNPINLNQTTKEELLGLHILTPSQIHQLFEYLESFGPLVDIHELQAIPGFDQLTIENLLPFVVIRNDENSFRHLAKRIISEDNNYLMLRYTRTLQQRKGFNGQDSSAQYLGKPGKHYLRFRITHPNDFSLGLTLEKDPGEVYIWKPKKMEFGADFYSFHFQVKEKGRLKNLIFGDYGIQYGQGLVLSSGFAMGKGLEVITTTRRNNLGIRPHTAALENNFFRGISATYSINKHLTLTPIYSYLEQDGIIKEENKDRYIQSIQNTGLHNTQSTLNAKDALYEQNLGGVLLFKNQRSNLQLGFTFLQTDFQVPIKKSKQLYNIHEFEGSQNRVMSAFYTLDQSNFSFFGEIAQSNSQGIAWINGLLLSLTQQVETSLILRNYAVNFHSFYGRAFGENSGGNQNEQGWYWGVKYRPNRYFTFNVYADQFRFPWSKTRSKGPTSGYEFQLSANWSIQRHTSLRGSVKTESKPVNVDSDLPVKVPSEGIKQSGLLHLDHEVDKNWTIKSRVQISQYKYEQQITRGYLLMQAIALKLSNFSASWQTALFETDDFTNRQYIYEKNVLYAFSLPAFSGSGIRNNLLIQLNPVKNITLYLRGAITQYLRKKEISSGRDLIKGNTQTEISVQARFKF